MSTSSLKPEINLTNLYQHLTIADTLKAPSASASSVNWNDEYFDNSYAQKFRYKTRPTPSQGIIYAKAFLNWYVYNTFPSSVEDTIMGLLASIPLSADEYLINDYFFSEEITASLTCPGSVDKSKDKLWQSTCQGTPVPGDNQQSSASGLQSGASLSSISVTVDNANKWYDNLWDMLCKSPVEGTYPSDVYSAMVYVGYICLQMLRVCVKEKNSVSVHIVKYTNVRVNNLFSYKHEFTVTIPPHDGMMDKFQSMYYRFQPGSIKTLTWVIYSHINPPSERKDLVESIFRSAGLLALSQVGLGCLGWLSKAASKADSAISVILKYMSITRHENMILSILQFVNSIGSNNNEKSWPWARLFTDGAFQELSIRRDSMFGMIMMVVATGATMDHEMWDIDQFKKYSEIFEIKKAAHDYGHLILHHVMKVTEESCKTDEAKMIITNLASMSSITTNKAAEVTDANMDF